MNQSTHKIAGHRRSARMFPNHSSIGQGMKPPKAQSACLGQHPYTETSPSIGSVVMYALYVLVYMCVKLCKTVISLFWGLKQVLILLLMDTGTSNAHEFE